MLQAHCQALSHVESIIMLLSLVNKYIQNVSSEVAILGSIL